MVRPTPPSSGVPLASRTIHNDSMTLLRVMKRDPFLIVEFRDLEAERIVALEPRRTVPHQLAILRIVDGRSDVRLVVVRLLYLAVWRHEPIPRRQRTFIVDFEIPSWRIDIGSLQLSVSRHRSQARMKAPLRKER